MVMYVSVINEQLEQKVLLCIGKACSIDCRKVYSMFKEGRMIVSKVDKNDLLIREDCMCGCYSGVELNAVWY